VPTYKDTEGFIDLLGTIPYDGGAVEITNTTEEITFLGVPGQPDFARLEMTIYPSGRVPELKSLKEYFFAWRDVVVSYERFIDVVFEHMMRRFEPARLRLVLTTKLRGGISSRLVVDSDWSVRGGEESFRDEGWGSARSD
jgi:7-cyano-7-deazaguanine reductase